MAPAGGYGPGRDGHEHIRDGGSASGTGRAPRGLGDRIVDATARSAAAGGCRDRVAAGARPGRVCRGRGRSRHGQRPGRRVPAPLPPAPPSWRDGRGGRAGDPRSGRGGRTHRCPRPREHLRADSAGSTAACTAPSASCWLLAQCAHCDEGSGHERLGDVTREGVGPPAVLTARQQAPRAVRAAGAATLAQHAPRNRPSSS